MNTIKELVKEHHGNAVSKGFYNAPTNILQKMFDCGFTDEQIKQVKDAFIAQRLMLITSELGEALESNRKDKVADLRGLEYDLSLPNPNFTEDFKRNVKDTFEDELADATIRLFDLAGWLHIDLEKHVNLKHLYNTSREHMHGKKY